MISEQNRPYLIVDGRNRQRVFGELSQVRVNREKALMDKILLNEQKLFIDMGLIGEPLDDIAVNPNLTTFLDGEGLAGYADRYSSVEYLEPGTRLEMELEGREIQKHLSSTLSLEHINQLKTKHKPLVIIEGGAGPDLRTFEQVCSVLAEKKEELLGLPIQIVITDISKRMAVITASKIRTSSGLIDQDLDIKTAVLAADVFEVIEKSPDDALSYALLPFGVLSFGLDGKKPHEIMSTLNNKLVSGAGVLVTVYNSVWRNYAAKLEQEVEDVNNSRNKLLFKVLNSLTVSMIKLLINGNYDELGLTNYSDWRNYLDKVKAELKIARSKLDINDLNPFVIKILDDQMQVDGGLPFYCKTFIPSELVELMGVASYQVDSCKTTPQGWAYWPTELLRKAVETRVWPEGCPLIPTPSEMDMAKEYLLNLLGSNNEELAGTIPDGNQILEYPAPYITLTATKK